MESQLIEAINLPAENDKNVSINYLSKDTIKELSNLLNPIKILRTENNLPRYWQGLAELCGISGEAIQNIQEHSSDPTKEVLECWSKKNGSEYTIEKLFQFLQELDRFDILDDLQPLIEKDLKRFKAKPCNDDILTRDDIMNDDLKTYDAYVMYHCADTDFAQNLIDTLENQYKLLICTKDRDVLAVGFEHEIILKLITKRCKKLIVILSQAFINNEENNNYYQFIKGIELQSNMKKIIPCVYNMNTDLLPTQFRPYFILNYSRQPQYFWKKLYNSIKQPVCPSPISDRSIELSSKPSQEEEKSLEVKQENAPRSTTPREVKFCIRNSATDLEDSSTDSSQKQSSDEKLEEPKESTKKKKNISKRLIEYILPKPKKSIRGKQVKQKQAVAIAN